MSNMILQNVEKIEKSPRCISGCTLTSAGGGGKEMICRVIAEDYKKNIIQVIKEDMKEISIEELMGESIPESPNVYFKNEWGMDMDILIFDSHKNDIKFLKEMPDKVLDALAENKSIIAIPNTYNGCGGDPIYGIKLLEEHHTVLKSMISKHLKRNCIIYISADGGTSLSTSVYLSKYKDEIHGCSEPYMCCVSFPQKQILNARLDNIEFNKEQMNDWLKRNVLSIILYSVDYANHVANMNDVGRIIDRRVLDIIHGRAMPRTAYAEQLAEADSEFIKASSPLRYIYMGSNDYYKVHGGSRVDIKDLLNLIQGKSIIPCYLRAKNVGELSKRISEIKDPICYIEDESGNREYIPEVGIASTIFNCLAPFPKKNRVDKLLYIVKMMPGMTIDYGYLLECIAKFVNMTCNISRKDIIIWTYEDKYHLNTDLEIWAYFILDDYKAYIEESIMPYILGEGGHY